MASFALRLLAHRLILQENDGPQVKESHIRAPTSTCFLSHTIYLQGAPYTHQVLLEPSLQIKYKKKRKRFS